MNSHVMEARPWSFAKWVVFLVGAVASQVLGLAWIGGDRAVPVFPAEAPAKFSVRILGQSVPTDQLFSDLQDPTLFALPSRKNVSGKAWMELVPLPYVMPDWSESPRFLDPRGEFFSASLEQFLKTNQAQSFQLTEIAPFKVQLPVVEKRIDAGASSLVVEGPLQGRAIVKGVTVPGFPSDDLLRPTHVDVMVTAEGLVFSRRLLKSSGLQKADNVALQLAGQIVFEKLAAKPTAKTAGEGWMEGRLIFRWQTLPLAGSPSP